MPKKVTVSSPAKLMLLGEHAVVYNRPCLVTAVGQRMMVSMTLTDNQLFELDAPDVNVSNYSKPISDLGKGEIPKGAKFVEYAVRNINQKYSFTSGVRVGTRSEFSSLFGFGSSSASTVCVVKGLSELLNLKLQNQEIFDIAYKTVLDIQGKGSGFDVAAAIYGGTLYFLTGGKIIEPIHMDTIPLVVGYSGVKSDTVSVIGQVAKKMEQYPEKVNRIYDAIGQLVEQAKVAIRNNDWEAVGKYMNFNQEYLRDLGVSTEKLEDMISAAKSAGAYGAKLSGAGGGDCMIAVVSEETRKDVSEAISSVGGQVLDVITNVEGVRVENDPV